MINYFVRTHKIDININSITGNYSATVGLQNETGLIASQIDVYNGTYFHDNTHNDQKYEKEIMIEGHLDQ